MNFSRPTVTQLDAGVRTDIDTRMPGADSRLRRRNALDVFARTLAGAAGAMFGMIDRRARFFPDPDNPEGIARWSGLLEIPRIAAAAATGEITLTGTDAATAPAGTVLARADGARFVIEADATIVAGTASATVNAELAGVDGAMEEGQMLTFVSPVAGIAATAIVAAGGLTGAADAETDAALSARIYARMRRPPSGGKVDDYIAWATSIAGVTRAWVYENWDGFGTVKVLFVCDGREDIIPEAGDIAAVTAKVEAERPVCADVTVAAPVADPMALTIDLTPDTAPVRAAVTASLRDLIAREAEPGGTLLISHIREAISIAAGEADHVVTVPSANVTADPGDIITLGAITWA